MDPGRLCLPVFLSKISILSNKLTQDAYFDFKLNPTDTFTDVQPLRSQAIHL